MSPITEILSTCQLKEWPGKNKFPEYERHICNCKANKAFLITTVEGTTESSI